jgi:hypothetical protein
MAISCGRVLSQIISRIRDISHKVVFAFTLIASWIRSQGIFAALINRIDQFSDSSLSTPNQIKAPFHPPQTRQYALIDFSSEYIDDTVK